MTARNRIRIFFHMMMVITFLIIGCNHDSGSSPTINEGQFKDSLVKGLNYETDTQAGITDNNGKFKYQTKEVITFSIGAIVLGQATGKAIITPLDLVDGATDVYNNQVTNICRLLQTLDDDGNVYNGIVITEAVKNATNSMSINFNVDTNQFEKEVDSDINTLTSLTSAGQRSLVSAQEAQTHLNETLGLDKDGDGHTVNQGDCNDNEATVYPGATEICDDGIDNDCDGQTDCDDSYCSDSPSCEVCTDADGDGYYVQNGCGTAIDCDDNDANVYPGATEICGDGIDQDCNGSDLAPEPDPGECIKFIVDNQQEFDRLPDYFKNLSSPKDGHVFFVAELTMEEIKCGYIFLKSIIESFIIVDSDAKIYPLINYLIKGIQYEENDFSSNTAYIEGSTFKLAFEIPIHSILSHIEFTYDYGSSWDDYDSSNPGTIDIDVSCEVCTDADGDGYYVQNGCGTAIDCNDNDSDINPGSSEICDDGIDNDCDGQTDCDDSYCSDSPSCEVCTDADGDGYYVQNGCGTAIDCDDNNTNIHPGASDICGDGIDQDCSGSDQECEATLDVKNDFIITQKIYIDGTYVGDVKPGQTVRFGISAGSHFLEACDSKYGCTDRSVNLKEGGQFTWTIFVS